MNEGVEIPPAVPLEVALAALVDAQQSVCVICGNALENARLVLGDDGEILMAACGGGLCADAQNECGVRVVYDHQDCHDNGD